jgi:hypothetical protein
MMGILRSVGSGIFRLPHARKLEERIAAAIDDAHKVMQVESAADVEDASKRDPPIHESESEPNEDSEHIQEGEAPGRESAQLHTPKRSSSSVGGRLFAVSVPDWGQDHLSPEAIAAYVDGELAERPYDRATRHLSECAECAASVVAQGEARATLRSARVPSLPSSVLSNLQEKPDRPPFDPLARKVDPKFLPNPTAKK